MPLRYENRITREMVQAEPDTLWVFGDNLLEQGFGGQAAQMRGEPNAVGIPTKAKPARHPAAYFTDADFIRFWEASLPKLERLRNHLEGGGDVVWPTDGIGTGLAELPQRAPRLWSALERARKRLEALSQHEPSQTEGR